MLSVRFWGVRGSIPCPGSNTVIYGGNTSCLEIRADEKLVIVDLGTGARPLGDFLMKNDLKKYGKIEADILLTHTHWDHIMGFPSFTPIYIPGTVLRITGPVTYDNETLESIIKTQLSYRFWPVRTDELGAKLEFKQIKEETLDLGGGLKVTSKFLNHPVLCLGYRFDYQGKSIAMVFDHEPFYNLFTNNEEGKVTAEEENEKISRFVNSADIIIHDAQYSEEEYSKHVGWGHASCAHGVTCAINANAKKLVFFHHDPSHTDKQLKHLEKFYKKKSPLKVMMAKEGMLLEA
jgi:phosphoribosyl 1,2-cyclic phosphodiesterase